ncbi:unnamed protein product [Meganyctiphanes norvegica]|uniref:Uncharacterized protein n=1 Tax=Meganyctiphanes norvegica TaxID=48144 RepID=A0AAV2Q1I0_MEGNR
MSEKGDMPPDHGDQVSLPPNYAPSEAYTESPPPAYSNKKSSMVAVTRMVCLTILAGAFMIGFFSLTHSWLQTRSCNCQHEDHDGIRSASFVEFPPAPQVEALVAHKEEEVPENTIITDINNNMSQLEEELNEQDKPKLEENGQIMPSDDIHPTIDEEVSALQQEVEILEEVESELEDERHILEESAQQEFDEVNKNIKIPLDVILGNPALSGRDVNCKVDRRQQDIGGLMTQAIIVTCEDKDDGPAITPLLSSPSSKRPLGPPLSLLAPIMKMLAAKAKQRSQEFNSMNLNKPEIIFGAKPVIMASKMSGPIEGPIRMIRGPFPGPMSGPSPFPMPAPRFLSMRGPNMSGPMRVPNMSGPMRGPNMSGPMRGPNMSGPRGPMPDPRGSPIPNFNENRRISDGGRQPKMIPMSINPMRMANGRSIRVLPFGKESRPDFFPNLPKDLPPFPNRPPAFPFKNEQELRILPEPQPRGLNSPIALPGLRILPGRFLNVFPQPSE